MSTTKDTTDRKVHAWTEEQLQYLAERPSMPRSELFAGFRKKFPEATMTDNAIQGRRYRLKQDGSTKYPEIGGTALVARVEDARKALEDAERALAEHEAKTGDSTPTVEEITSLPIDEVRSLAERFGVSKGGSKKAIAERIHARTA